MRRRRWPVDTGGLRRAVLEREWLVRLVRERRWLDRVVPRAIGRWHAAVQ
jgi:hypothetical protein